MERADEGYPDTRGGRDRERLSGSGVGPIRRVGTPIVGEVAALLRDKTVLYDNGNTVRRRLALERFQSGKLRGAILDISRSPLDLADQFAGGSDNLAERAQAVQRLLEPDRGTWEETASLDLGWRRRSGGSKALPEPGCSDMRMRSRWRICTCYWTTRSLISHPKPCSRTWWARRRAN